MIEMVKKLLNKKRYVLELICYFNPQLLHQKDFKL